MDELSFAADELQLVGTVKNLIFQNEENGYTVLRLDVGTDEPVTVVGCLPFTAPGEGWIYLGFRYHEGVTDLAPASLTKMKQKMRRKTRALERWRARNGLEREKAAAAFIRVFNRKLFENPADNELTWAYWFFPALTTDESLRQIDAYAQDCIRFLLTGTRTKARYNARYGDLKKLGYRSLVHEYHAFRENKDER